MNVHGESAPVLLLVEDDSDAVKLFGHIFGKIRPDWIVVHASDGLDAVHYMMNEPMPNLIVTDLQMPRMTGQELIAWMRSTNVSPRVPIVILSGRSEPDLRDQLIAAGADDYLCKLSPINEIREVLSRYTLAASPAESSLLTSNS